SSGCRRQTLVDCQSGYSCMSGLGCQKDVCLEEWDCKEWSACTGGTQVRSCIELNGCGTEDDAPVMSQSCVTPVIEAAAPVAEAPVETFQITSAVQAETMCDGQPCPDRWTSLRKPIIVVLLVTLGMFVFVRTRRRKII
ncbi:MAG: hypothetical protein AABY01_03275, partial [Nanoarchaeota archaeon]